MFFLMHLFSLLCLFVSFFILVPIQSRFQGEGEWRRTMDLFIWCICFVSFVFLLVCLFILVLIQSRFQGEGECRRAMDLPKCSFSASQPLTYLGFTRYPKYTHILLLLSFYGFGKLTFSWKSFQICRNDYQNILTWDSVFISFLGALCTEWTRIWVKSFPIIWRQVLLFFLNMNQKFSKWNLRKLKCCQQSANLFWFMSMKICVWYSSALGRSEEKI